MQAQGNDYIYFDLRENKIEFEDWRKLTVRLSDRHFGIGGDGIVLILPSQIADAKMRMFNADGSEAEICGSALRCIGYYLHQKHKFNQLFIETKVGKVLIETSENPKMVSVDMGIPVFVKQEKIAVAGVYGYQISAGNPHYVCFLDELIPERLNQLGKKIEHAPIFPNQTNVDFVNIINRQEMEVYFWERGSGNTLACGSGAISSFFVALQNDLVDENVTVKMPGGNVITAFQENSYWLQGTVEFVFQGEIEL